MRISSLTLTDWRSYRSARVEFSSGLTAVVGANGQGKTNLLEAVGWLAGLGSFRGVPDDALIRADAASAVLRAEASADDGRDCLVEAELNRAVRTRVQVNRRRLQRIGDLVGVLPVTVFSPDDLDLVKGSPSGRRLWIDDAAAARHRSYTATRAELGRILKQRNALLRSVGGRLDADAEFTLDVWDERLVRTGTEVRQRRCELLDELSGELSAAYRAISKSTASATACYRASWNGDLAVALAEARRTDLRRAATTVGPHLDEVALSIDGAPARTQASQGEQRSLALALRLAVDAVLRSAGSDTPILLLDDVFSELDAERSAALLGCLPQGQRILTTAGQLPPGAVPDQVLRVHAGRISEDEA